MNYDCIIIGGGASGLCAAIKVKNEFNKVLIIEHNDRVGKKILSTGNGKCNLTNLFCKTDLFNSNPENVYPFFSNGNNDFIEKVISAFDCNDTVKFFNSLGILTLEKNGYVYPRSEQASSICDVLRFSALNIGVDIITDYHIGTIKVRKESDFAFNIDSKFFTRNLILATGGKSASKTGSDGSGYKYAQSLGHTVTRTYPALCGLKSDFKYCRELSGVRNDASLTLLDASGNIYAQVSGNLQFTNYGISGIPVFQISSIAAKLLDNKSNPSVTIDLLPEYDRDKLEEFLLDKSPDNQLLLGILNKKLADLILKIIPKKSDKKAYISAIASTIKQFKINISGTNSFEEAQTTAGGINTDEIDPLTMESRIHKGLYFIGEIIDVNGICGGYNLQWAWSTADIAAKAILKK